MPDIKDTLSERGETYGDYEGGIRLRATLMEAILSRYQNVHGKPMDRVAKLKIYDIICKISRLAVTPDHADSWHDMQGYARLAEESYSVDTEGDPCKYRRGLECVKGLETAADCTSGAWRVSRTCGEPDTMDVCSECNEPIRGPVHPGPVKCDFNCAHWRGGGVCVRAYRMVDGCPHHKARTDSMDEVVKLNEPAPPVICSDCGEPKRYSIYRDENYCECGS